MVKKSIKFALSYFLTLTVWQLIFKSKINWIENIAISFITFLILLFYEWSKIPYNWKKDDDR
ncbi:hypothetical protein BFG57_07955 [Bacillus solimangrovi]|uniref:Uncharacterized protein n=1 Tax=Bacillus solimangrovi TaxID=1305675 RepID=A0A1E5LJW1_9BACI|nr:hypothetical protein BFG57_07955 [Bacillus solimangrovi]